MTKKRADKIREAAREAEDLLSELAYNQKDELLSQLFVQLKPDEEQYGPSWNAYKLTRMAFETVADAHKYVADVLRELPGEARYDEKD